MTKARDLANGGFGLVLVKPSSVVNGTDNGKGIISFSAQTSVSLNGVFNSSYDNYKILLDQSGSADSDINWRFRISTSDDSDLSYSFQFSDITTVSTLTSNRTVSGSSGRISPINNGLISRTELTVFAPNLARNTGWYSQTQRYDTTTPTTQIISGVYTQTKQFTGFTLLPQSGNVTGTISIYGFYK